MAETRLTARLRQQVAKRAHNCCEYCLSQARFAIDPFSIEHILPVSRGGRNQLDNLALACQGCNNHKYTHIHAIDPASGQAAPLYHPRHDAWADHFAWDTTFTHLIGLTPTGRATVALLQLNRPGLLNLRRVLYQAGEHPPAIPSKMATASATPTD